MSFTTSRPDAGSGAQAHLPVVVLIPRVSRHCVFLAAALVLLAGLLHAAEPRPLAEHQIKALYLSNFIKYVNWPEDSFTNTNSPYVIGVLASTEVQNDLVEI